MADLSLQFSSTIYSRLTEKVIGDAVLSPVGKYTIKKFGNSQVSVGSTRSGAVLSEFSIFTYNLAGTLNAYFLYRTPTDLKPFYGELVLAYPRKRHVNTLEWKRLNTLWSIMKKLSAVNTSSNITSIPDAVFHDATLCK